MSPKMARNFNIGNSFNSFGTTRKSIPSFPSTPSYNPPPMVFNLEPHLDYLKSISDIQDLQDFRRNGRDGHLIVQDGSCGNRPLLIINFGKKFGPGGPGGGPVVNHGSKYKVEGKYHIPIGFKSIIKWDNDEIIFMIREGSFGPEFQIIYLPTSATAEDFTLFEWNANIAEIWDQLLTVLETQDRDMHIFSNGPWKLFGVIDESVQLAVNRNVGGSSGHTYNYGEGSSENGSLSNTNNNNHSNRVEGILYCTSVNNNSDNYPNLLQDNSFDSESSLGSNGDNALLSQSGRNLFKKPTLSDYEHYLGFDSRYDDDFSWIIHEFRSESLPEGWKQYLNSEGNMVYFSYYNGPTVWRHPLLHKYLAMLKKARKRKLVAHWKSIMDFQIECLMDRILDEKSALMKTGDLLGASKIVVESIENVKEMERIFKVNLKNEPYLVHVLRKALRHYYDRAKSLRNDVERGLKDSKESKTTNTSNTNTKLSDVEDFRRLMQRYRDMVGSFDQARQTAEKQASAVLQCVECSQNSGAGFGNSMSMNVGRSGNINGPLSSGYNGSNNNKNKVYSSISESGSSSSYNSPNLSPQSNIANTTWRTNKISNNSRNSPTTSNTSPNAMNVVRDAVIYCDDCKDLFCQACFDRLHAKGRRKTHKRTWVELGTCADCEEALAVFHCVQCQDAFCPNCFEEFHRRGGRRNHVPIILRSFSTAKKSSSTNSIGITSHAKPCIPEFNFGKISDTGITMGGDSAQNLAKALSPWCVFEDESAIKMYVNLETGEKRRDMPLSMLNDEILGNLDG